jgi:LysM repeat protein
MFAPRVARRGGAGIMPEMTERSPAERPTACPFLAFDEDRDFRADRPDHRHRCFAEARPAPRAISHQELFCLGGAFAECPTFSAWAAREAAAVRRPTIREPEPVRGAGSTTSASRAVPPAATAAGTAGARVTADRDWLAPPPWVADAPLGPDDEPSDQWADEPRPAAPPRPAAYPQGDDVDAQADLGETPAFLVGRDRAAAPPPPVDGQEDDDLSGIVGGAALIGGAASVAYGTAGRASTPPPSAPRPATQPVSGRASAPPPAGYTSAAARASAEASDSLWIHPDSLDPADDVDWEEAADAAAAARVSRSRRDDGRAKAGGSRFGRGRSRPTTSGQARPLPERAADPSAPAWERPRRFDSYPTIKKSRGAGGIPRVAVWAGLLLAAALVLFLVPPLFLGGGGGGSTASPTPSASADSSVAPSPTATVAPSPTPFTYTVKAGDTLSRIAGKYKIAVADILAVNPDMKNPDSLQIGQKIVIPLPVSSIIPDAGTPTASAAP